MSIMQASRHRQHGLAIVEYVIVLPLCLMLIIVTGEFGRAFLQYNTMTKSVQDGVRHLASRANVGSTGTVTISAELETEVQNLVVYGNTLGTGSPLLPGFETDSVIVTDQDLNVRVEASYAYDSIFFFVPRFFYGGDIDVTGYTFETAVTMRAL